MSRRLEAGGGADGVTRDCVRLGEVDGSADVGGLRSGEVDDNIRRPSCDDTGERVRALERRAGH